MIGYNTNWGGGTPNKLRHIVTVLSLALAFMLGAGFFVAQNAYANDSNSEEYCGLPWELVEIGDVYDTEYYNHYKAYELKLGSPNITSCYENSEEEPDNAAGEIEYPWNENMGWEHKITTVTFQGPVVANGHLYKFLGYDGLKTINNLEYLDTANVKSMRCLFYSSFAGNDSDEVLNISSFNTDNVTDMMWMFSGCSGVKQIIFGDNFNTNKVTSFHAMFSDCKSITEFDLSNFDTAKAESIAHMFGDCWSLQKVDVSHFVTDNVESFASMFFNCESLTELDLSNFNTSKATRFTSMFYGCENLQTLNVRSFDTTKAIDIGDMFMKCSNLKNLILGEGFDNYDKENMASNPWDTTFKRVFKECPKLTDSASYRLNDECPLEEKCSTYSKARLQGALGTANTAHSNYNDANSVDNVNSLVVALQILTTAVDTMITAKQEEDILDAIDRLTVLKTDPDLSQTEVEKIEAAILKLQSIGENSTFDDAEEAISFAESAKESAEDKKMEVAKDRLSTLLGENANLSKDNYTDASFETFETAYEAADEVYKNTESDTDAINEAYNTLQNAIQELVPACIVKFESNGGTEISPTKVIKGQILDEPIPPTREGYDINGWYKDSELEYKWNFANDKVESPITLYAKWKTIEYSIAYDLDGGEATNPSSYNIESENIVLNAPTRGEDLFVGWKWAGQEEPQKEVTISKGSTGEKSFTAVYKLASEIAKENLQKALEEAKAIDTSKYTDDSVKALANAITAAEKVLNKDTATKEDFDKAKQDIADAVSGLKEKPTDEGGNNGQTDTPAVDPTNQMGTDGTALGEGASAEAAEKAILGMKSDEDPAGSKFAPLMAKSTKVAKNNVTLQYKKPKGAVKFVIYGNQCGKNVKMKKLATTSKTKFKITKIAGKKLKKGKYHKFIIVALNKDNKVVSTSKVVHVATSGGKVGNHKAVVTKAKVDSKGKKIKTLKPINKTLIAKGKKVTIKSTLTLKSNKLKAKGHTKAKYESSNPKVAKVDKKGKITAVGKGSCKIYVYAPNGVAKTINIKVN